MPRADAYLVRDEGATRLEDRFVRSELWLAKTLLGRWYDDDDRVFSLYRLDTLPPAVAASETVTRTDYAAERAPLEKKDAKRLRATLESLAPCVLADSPRRSHLLPRGYEAVDYWHHPTNDSAVVCAFLPKDGEVWHAAVWELASGDVISDKVTLFEECFLEKEFAELPSVRAEAHASRTSARRVRGKSPRSERDLLRDDAHFSVTNYAGWHWTDASTYTVLDDLPRALSFVPAFTNEMPRLYAAYAEALPSPLDGSNVLCVARLFASRDEYLDVVGDDLAWSAAYWSQARRELVAYLPQSGTAELMKTLRHEAFHQYLSYATAMIQASPWLNEGYAQYFENVDSRDWELPEEMTPARVERLATALPALLALDYRDFYVGTDAERLAKYRLAWSIAVFLEKGAPNVRFRPFENLKRDYMAALLKSQDMLKATLSAFGSSQRIELFAAEWKKFWCDSM